MAIQPPAFDLSPHFDDPNFSDLVLRVFVTSGDQQPPQGAEPARSYFVSKLVLGQAEFFKSQILRWTPGMGPERSRGSEQATTAAAQAASEGRMELTVSMAADALGAFELLLRLMYRTALPEAAALDAMLLVKAYAAADMYCAPCCTEALGVALCSLSAGLDLDLDLLRAVYSLPEGRGHLAPLMAKCNQHMVQAFGDVPSVITSDQLRQEFCSMPFAAVLAWLKADDLKVHSENCVMFLLSAWVASKDHAACPDEQLEELACHVRVAQLSPLYLQCVLPSLAWFSSQAKSLSFLLVQRLSGKTTANHWSGPPAWQAVPRKRTGLPQLALNWDIGGCQLEDLYSGQTVQSELLYVNGVYCALEARACHGLAADQSETLTLGLFLTPSRPLMRHVLSDKAYAEASMVYQSSMQVKVPSTGAWKSMPVHEVSGFAPGWGFVDILACSGSRMRDVVASFLLGGKLAVGATSIRLG